MSENNTKGCKYRFIKLIQDKKELEGWTNEFIATKTKKATSYIGFILNGDRNPSLDTLFALSDGLDIPFEDLAFCFVFVNGYNESVRPRKVGFLKLNNSRRPKETGGERISGTLTAITESEMEEFFKTDVSGDFLVYVKKYLVDKVYKNEYEEYQNSRKENKDNLQALQQKISANPIIKDIIDLLFPMEDEDLIYIKEQIELYKRFIQRSKGDDLKL